MSSAIELTQWLRGIQTLARDLLQTDTTKYSGYTPENASITVPNALLSLKASPFLTKISDFCITDSLQSRISLYGSSSDALNPLCWVQTLLTLYQRRAQVDSKPTRSGRWYTRLQSRLEHSPQCPSAQLTFTFVCQAPYDPMSQALATLYRSTDLIPSPWTC